MTHRLEVRSARAAHRRSDTPLLFVHGAWLGSWVWDEQVLPYVTAQGYDAYAVDLRGHGHSDGRRHLRWTRVRDYVRDVALVAGELGPGTVPIGYSMGGFVVQKYLEAHRPPAAALVASVPPTGVLPLTLRIARTRPRDFLRTTATLSLYPLVEDPAQVHALMFTPELDPATAASYQRRLQDESYLAFLDMLALDLVRPRRIATPLLVVGAQRDELFPEPAVRATAAAYGTTAVSIPGAAHGLMLETHWRALADTLLDWLRPRVG
ncbi:MAG: alpha/beta fold hydrolase [Nocardioides sp.]